MDDNAGACRYDIRERPLAKHYTFVVIDRKDGRVVSAHEDRDSALRGLDMCKALIGE